MVGLGPDVLPQASCCSLSCLKSGLLNEVSPFKGTSLALRTVLTLAEIRSKGFFFDQIMLTETPIAEKATFPQGYVFIPLNPSCSCCDLPFESILSSLNHPPHYVVGTFTCNFRRGELPRGESSFPQARSVLTASTIPTI